MSYYPTNFYSNYPYGGNNIYQQYQPQQNQTIMQQSAQMPVSAGLQGKIVDGEEMVRATDVPFGGYGIFPKADFSKVFIKTWNNNGTTSIIEFNPIVETDKERKEEVDTNVLLLEKMKDIESKIDSMVSAKTTVQAVAPKVPEKGKEIKANAY